MRITGTLHNIGTIHECGDETVTGILITADESTLRAASNLLCATVDIYPHPVNELIAGECTPENYAHAMARLAHAEASSPTADHLAREVRSSQALIAANAELEKVNKNMRDDLERHRIGGFQDTIAAREHTIVNMQGTISELVSQLQTRANQNDAVLAKQAEQERLLSIYRTKYHEADRALQQAHADLAAAQAQIREYEADDICDESTLGTVQTPTPTFDDEGNET